VRTAPAASQIGGPLSWANGKTFVHPEPYRFCPTRTLPEKALNGSNYIVYFRSRCWHVFPDHFASKSPLSILFAPSPGSVLAFFDPARAVHCLIDDLNATSAHDQGRSAHVHADGVVHHHDHGGESHRHSQGQSHAGDCCWLFSVSALARDPDITFGVSSARTTAFRIPRKLFLAAIQI
jgi:hypothetical protein